MKTDYNADNNSCTSENLANSSDAHECPAPYHSVGGENVLRPNLTVKLCNECKVEKNIDEFWFRNRAKNYRSPYCIPCDQVKRRETYKKDRSKILQQKKNYWEQNKEQIKEARKTHNVDKEGKRLTHLKWERNRLATDPNYRLEKNLRRMTNRHLKGVSNGESLRLLGCSVEDFRKHIEKLFKPGMSWENYGKWHLDHIFPLSKINHDSREEIAYAYHYTNLQPLWAADNIRKGNKTKGLEVEDKEPLR